MSRRPSHSSTRTSLPYLSMSMINRMVTIKQQKSELRLVENEKTNSGVRRETANGSAKS